MKKVRVNEPGFSIEYVRIMREIIEDLQAENARLTAELDACRQQAFDTGREVGERTAGVGELPF